MTSFEDHAVAFAAYLDSVVGDADDSAQLPALRQALHLEARPDEAHDLLLDMDRLRDDSGSGVRVLRVRNDEDLVAWSQLVAEQLPLEDGLAPLLTTAVQAAGFGPNAPAQAFIGLLDGVRVGTSFVYAEGELAGIHAVTTATDARRRGIGRALAEKAIRGGESVGALHAVARVSREMRKNGERMGARVIE